MASKLSLLFAMMLLGPATAASAPVCFAPWRGSVHPYGSSDYSRDFLDSAAVIVRAIAVGPSSDTSGLALAGPSMGILIGRLEPVEFRITATLKGSAPPRLVILGQLVEAHRVNDGPFPYEWPRHKGGSCWAFKYSVGKEYLLVLKSVKSDRLTPYWASMTLANEQIRSEDDPWLAFALAHLRQRSQ